MCNLTAHGPLLNPILPKETRPIALKWTLYDPTLNSLPLYQIDTAANWTEFSAALETWSWPTQNVVYADDQGHIAYHAIGQGSDAVGRTDFARPVPHDQLNLRYEWGHPVWIAGIGLHSLRPDAACGRSAVGLSGHSQLARHHATSALIRFNNDVSNSAHRRVARPLSRRAHLQIARRPRRAHAQRHAGRADRCLQRDGSGDGPAAWPTPSTTPTAWMTRLRKAADLMRSWDGRLTTDSAAASIVTQTRKALWPLILEPKLGKDADRLSLAGVRTLPRKRS